MARKAVLFSDRAGFEARWRSLLEEKGFSVLVAPPADLASHVAPGFVAIFDTTAKGYDEDELLAAVGYAKARRARVVLCAGDGSEATPGVNDDFFFELSAGLIARNRPDRVRIAEALLRRSDPDRASRFEFVTVAPSNDELLAVLGDGRCLTLPRPVVQGDDGSAVIGIELSEDATSATLKLETGQHSLLTVSHVQNLAPGSQQDRLAAPLGNTPGLASSSRPSGRPVLVEGPQLGARLRELRKAAGLTQAELARRTGIHRPNIARVEAGRHTPSLETLSRLAEAIGVPTTDVFSEPS